MTTTTLTLRLSKAEMQLLSDYAHTCGVSVSEFVRSTALARIEDELDLAAWDEAKREFESDPHALTCAEVSAKYL